MGKIFGTQDDTDKKRENVKRKKEELNSLSWYLKALIPPFGGLAYAEEIFNRFHEYNDEVERILKKASYVDYSDATIDMLIFTLKLEHVLFMKDYRKIIEAQNKKDSNGQKKGQNSRCLCTRASRAGAGDA